MALAGEGLSGAARFLVRDGGLRGGTPPRRGFNRQPAPVFGRTLYRRPQWTATPPAVYHPGELARRRGAPLARWMRQWMRRWRDADAGRARRAGRPTHVNPHRRRHARALHTLGQAGDQGAEVLFRMAPVGVDLSGPGRVGGRV